MIAKILKAQRKERGLTQQEAAKIFHVTRQTISNCCAATFFICWICSSDQWRKSGWNHSDSVVVNDRYGLGMCDPL